MRSLRRQLTISVLLCFALLFGGGGALMYWSIRDSLYDQFDQALRVRALFLITQTEYDEGELEVRFSDRFLREFDDEVATDFFQLFDAAGNPADRSESLGSHSFPNRHGSVAEPDYWNLTLPNGDPARAIGIRFDARVRGRRPPHEPVASVVVAADRRELESTLAQFLTMVASGGLALLVVTGLVVPMILKRGLRPLDNVAERASRIDEHSLEERFPVDAMPAELRPIGDRLNDLLRRLQASFERERRFGSDLAHELRTPLSELRAMAEVALKWPEKRSAGTDQCVLEITLQMEKLVGRLLELSRAAHGRVVVRPERVDVARTIDGLLTALEPRIVERRLSVSRHYAADALIETDPVLLKSIIANLVENAVEYSPAGSEVRIAFHREGAAFRLHVTNLARELAAADLPNLFDRFWRKDLSRTGREHSGLGLALARSFAVVIGCKLEAEILEKETLVMTLSGPACLPNTSTTTAKTSSESLIV